MVEPGEVLDAAHMVEERIHPQAGRGRDRAGTGAPTVSAGRAFLSDVRLVVAVLNQARYPVFGRVFGVSRDQVNILTFVLALSVAGTTLDALERFIRHPWPLDGDDTAIAAYVLREAGFGIAGPEVRKAHLFGGLIAVAAIGSLTLPVLHRARITARITARRIGEQRMRIYGAAVERLNAEQHDPTGRASQALPQPSSDLSRA